MIFSRPATASGVRFGRSQFLGWTLADWAVATGRPSSSHPQTAPVKIPGVIVSLVPLLAFISVWIPAMDGVGIRAPPPLQELQLMNAPTVHLSESKSVTLEIENIIAAGERVRENLIAPERDLTGFDLGIDRNRGARYSGTRQPAHNQLGQSTWTSIVASRNGRETSPGEKGDMHDCDCNPSSTNRPFFGLAAPLA